ncbi:MAG: meta-cleavage compound hydrolase [Chloroflexota bacterium]|jgi:predicted TIM-barrel fold metal-dependent hydrolase|nr:meta-cleavage compound hydrolase [Chloroflexota bacterium]
MYKGQPVIDVHGHMSTPPHFRAFAFNLIALRSTAGGLDISDQLMETALGRHLRIMDERNIDVQMISPRPVAMMQWEAAPLVDKWTRVTNDVIYQQIKMHPDRYVGVAQLPQHELHDTNNCLEELERCVQEMNFVGALVNPDPGADRLTPGMDTDYWYPLYKKAEQLQVPLIVHPAITRDPRLERIPHSYQYNNITEETLATLLLEHSDVFERFPGLTIIICHCGGSLSRFVKSAISSGEAAGGQVGTAAAADTEMETLRPNNIYFDSCAYDKDFLTTAIKQRGVDRIVFGTEAPGSGTGVINPETGKPSDDLIPVIESMDFLTEDDKRKILRDNALRLFPRLKTGR